MDKVQIEHTNATQFSVEELEQRLEMTAAAAEMQAAAPDDSFIILTLTWTF